jgi:hypothetical protein
MPPLFIYSLNPLEPQLLSNTRTTNPTPLRSSSKNISKLIVLPFLYRLCLFNTTRSCLDSKHLVRRTPNYITTSRYLVQQLFLRIILFLLERRVILYASTSLIPLELVRRIDIYKTIGLICQNEPVPIRLQATYVASMRNLVLRSKTYPNCCKMQVYNNGAI